MSDEEEPRISDLIDVLDKLITRLEEMRMHVIERIKHGAKNAKKEELDATLAEAAYQCLPDAVKLLLEAGADVNLRWDFDRTPLHIAALSNKGAECAEVAGQPASESGRREGHDFKSRRRVIGLLHSQSQGRNI